MWARNNPGRYNVQSTRSPFKPSLEIETPTIYNVHIQLPEIKEKKHISAITEGISFGWEELSYISKKIPHVFPNEIIIFKVKFTNKYIITFS